MPAFLKCKTNLCRPPLPIGEFDIDVNHPEMRAYLEQMRRMYGDHGGHGEHHGHGQYDEGGYDDNEARTSNVKRRTSNVERRTSNVERRTSNVDSTRLHSLASTQEAAALNCGETNEPMNGPMDQMNEPMNGPINQNQMGIVYIVSYTRGPLYALRRWW